MAWLFILFADVFEIAWPFVLKSTTTFSKSAPLLGVLFSVPIMFFLGQSVKQLSAATVYATFVGLGTVGTATIGIAFFGESMTVGRVCSFLLIVAGVIGLKLFFTE